MMKVATIYTLYGRRAGAELCFEQTVGAIRKRCPQIKWIVLCNKEALGVIKYKMDYAEAVYVSWLDNQYKKALWLEFLSKRVVNNLQVDCFWIPSGCNHFPGKWNIPILTTFHDLGEYHVNNKYRKARMVFRKLICIPLNRRRANAFTAVSAFTKNDMQRFLKIDGKKIRVVYNGASPHSMEVPHNSLNLVAKYGLEAKKYFFTPGRTDYVGKGLDILLKAYKAIINEYPEIKLVLVGPKGEGHQKLINDINKSRLQNNALYLGRVDDETLTSLYFWSTSVIIASRFEGFGFPLLEAMKYGAPVISSNAGALEEIAGDAAIMFKTEDSDALMREMNKLLNAGATDIMELKNRGIERLLTFSWDRCADEMIEEFKGICKGKITPPQLGCICFDIMAIGFNKMLKVA